MEFFKRFKPLILISIVIVGLLIMWGSRKVNIRFPRKPPLETQPAEPAKEHLIEVRPSPPIPVRAFKVARIEFKDLLPAMGTVRGISEIDLRFEISGLIYSFNFREGDKVKEGEIITSLNQKDLLLKLKHAKSRLEESKAIHETSKKRFQMQESLYKVGAIIEQKLEEAKLECEVARLKITTAEAEVELAESELEKVHLRAPRDGLIGSRDAEPGEFVTSNTKVASLTDIKTVFVEVGIIERDINKVKLGQRAVVNVEAYPGRDFEGKIDNIFSVVEGRSRTLTTRIKLDNPELLLLPGMFATLGIFIIEIEDTITIPIPSLITPEPGINLVPVITSELYSVEEIERGLQVGAIELRRVEVGYTTGDYIQILSGLKEGELVVIEAQGELSGGARVRIIGLEEATATL